MIAFFCSTPYQIISAIQIRVNMICDEDADIYILNHFNNSYEIYNNIRKCGIFTNTIFLDVKSFTKSFESRKPSTLLKRVWVYLAHKSIVKKLLGNTKVYSKIYFSYPDLIIKLAIINSKRQNPNLKIYMFEDGTYAYNNFSKSNTFINVILNKLFGFSNCMDSYEAFLLYNTSLSFVEDKSKLIQISPIDLNNISLIYKYNEIFKYNSNDNIENKYIFFDSPYPEQEINNRAKNILDIIASFIGEKKITVKIHPRYTNKIYHGFQIYGSSSIPWEVICMNNDIENKVLISVFSTACFSPKLIFNKEPVVILLFKILKLHEDGIVNREGCYFVDNMKNLYSDSRKVFVPENIDELNEIILAFEGAKIY